MVSEVKLDTLKVLSNLSITRSLALNCLPSALSTMFSTVCAAMLSTIAPGLSTMNLLAPGLRLIIDPDSQP